MAVRRYSGRWTEAKYNDNEAQLRASLELARRHASHGHRVIALADGSVAEPPASLFSDTHLVDLTLLGLVCLIDPLRPEAGDAVRACRAAGIDVAMVTGDHPVTALAIGRATEFAGPDDQCFIEHSA